MAAGGHYFSAALTESGEVYTWGYNGYGCLGRGNSYIGTSNYTPERIQVGPIGTKVKAISAGYNFMFALTEEGDLYSWGYNGYGQLGLGHNLTNDNTQSPTKVPMPMNTKFKRIEAQSYAHVLAIDTNNKLYSWGYNGYGQLGNSFVDWSNSPSYVLPSLDIDFKDIATGWYTSMALSVSGDIFVFGLNSYGQLGLGDTTTRTVPTKLPTGLTYRAIAAGDQTSMAVTTDGKLYMWGNNIYGQYGNGSTSGGLLPRLIPLY